MENGQGTYPAYEFLLNDTAKDYNESEEQVAPDSASVQPAPPPPASTPSLVQLLQPLEYGVPPPTDYEILPPPPPRCASSPKRPQKRTFHDVGLEGSLHSERLSYADLGVKRFIIGLNKVPTWTTYYNDQRYLIPPFKSEDKNVSYKYDPYINKKVSLCFDDIDYLEVDAVVNSNATSSDAEATADQETQSAAGALLRLSCQGVRLSDQVEITPAFGRPSKFVIQSNSPPGDNVGKLQVSYWNALDILCRSRLKSIAFPCTLTCHAEIPCSVVAQIALQTVRQFLQLHGDKIDRVVFCVRHDKSIEIYRRWMQIYFPLP